MSNIKKISTLLFLLAQMCLTFAGNPTDPSTTTYVGFWLVRQANDEIKQVKVTEMPASIFFEGTEDVNESMVRELLGYKAIETFEGAAVEESLFMVMSYDSAEETSVAFNIYQNFVQWCYNTYVPNNLYLWQLLPGGPYCQTGMGQCSSGATICKGNNICFPASMKLTCAGSSNGG